MVLSSLLILNHLRLASCVFGKMTKASLVKVKKQVTYWVWYILIYVDQ
jgi:hypothetical protein